MNSLTPTAAADIHKNASQCPVFRIARGETNKFVLLVDPTTDDVDFIQVIEILM